MELEEICETCHWWKNIEIDDPDVKIGKCRIYAPTKLLLKQIGPLHCKALFVINGKKNIKEGSNMYSHNVEEMTMADKEGTPMTPAEIRTKKRILALEISRLKIEQYMGLINNSIQELKDKLTALKEEDKCKQEQ